MRFRKPKKDDQENIEKAYKMLINFINKNKIEPSLWVGACMSAIVNNYIKSKITYQMFCEDMDGIKKHYKSRWQEK